MVAFERPISIHPSLTGDISAQLYAFRYSHLKISKIGEAIDKRVSGWGRRGLLVLTVVGSILGATLPLAAQGTAPRIAAASDLKFAVDEIVESFRKETGKVVTTVFGSSGNFKTQIINGAPFQMFMSADEGFVFELADKGLTRDRGVLYAIGRVALFAPKGASWKPDASMTDLREALSDGRITRFAIANPEHAPYGRAAEESLRTKGLWETVSPKLVLGENVSQAAQFATSGSTQGGIFALSLALSPQVGSLGTYVLLPADLHKPLRQQMVLLKSADETTVAFYDYIQSPAARTILRKYGFLLPGEAM